MKLLVLLLPCKKSELSIRILWLIHTVRQQSYTNLCICSVQYVNYLVNQFELFIHVLGHFKFHHWIQVFFSSKVFCSRDQRIPESHELVGICVFHCKNVYKSKIFVVIFLENFEFYIQLVGNFFGLRNSSKSVLAFATILVLGTS